MKKFLSLILLLSLFTGCAKKKANDEVINENQGIALINATIIDGTGKEINNGILLFKNGIIEAVGSITSITIPNDYLQKDMKGQFLLPGFINSHVHRAYDETQLHKWLVSGVTTVRCLSNSGITDFIEQKNTLNQNINNAYIVQASPIISVPGGYGTIFVSNVEEATALVNDYAQKVDIIKFSIEDFCQGQSWKLMNQELINIIVNTAHMQNKRVAVHITRAKNLPYAINAEVDELSHMTDDYVSMNLINQIVEKEIYWVPTLELWQIVSDQYYAQYDIVAIDNLKRFYQAGGKIAFGTDFAGFSGEFDRGFPITEALLMSRAEMTNMDIIISGTKNAAILCDLENKIGTLEVGKDADILILSKNPLEDITNLESTYAVIHKGEILLYKHNYQE